jgi:hypothetical protein
MATLNDVRLLATRLESVEETTSKTVSWTVGGKTFVWERPLGKTDLRALGAAAPQGAIIAARVANLTDKDIWLERAGCFTTPHFEGYPAVLVCLGEVADGDLETLVRQAWTATVQQLPKRLQRTLEA